MTRYTDEQLTAFLDKELPKAHMAAIERAIETDPELSVRLASLHMEKGGLRELFDSWLRKAPKEKLQTMLPALAAEKAAPSGAVKPERGLAFPLIMTAIISLIVGFVIGKSSIGDGWVSPYIIELISGAVG